jgi:hypothetical protein
VPAGRATHALPVRRAPCAMAICPASVRPSPLSSLFLSVLHHDRLYILIEKLPH